MDTINEFTEEYEDCEETPFGSFEVKCSKCGSSNVDLDISLGYSPESGSWGSKDTNKSLQTYSFYM